MINALLSHKEDGATSTCQEECETSTWHQSTSRSGANRPNKMLDGMLCEAIVVQLRTALHNRLSPLTVISLEVTVLHHRVEALTDCAHAQWYDC
eukprot:388598-Amphidinium_carterae.1